MNFSPQELARSCSHDPNRVSLHRNCWEGEGQAFNGAAHARKHEHRSTSRNNPHGRSKLMSKHPWCQEKQGKTKKEKEFFFFHKERTVRLVPFRSWQVPVTSADCPASTSELWRTSDPLGSSPQLSQRHRLYPSVLRVHSRCQGERG